MRGSRSSSFDQSALQVESCSASGRRHPDQRESRVAKELVDVAEVVGAVLYFAGDASSYTTGSLLRIDGGAV